MPLWSLGLLAATAAQTDCDSIVVPPNQIGEPYAKFQTKCRGAPLLANVAGGLRVVAVLPLLESWAREHANASVLDFAPATLARRDATDDGMHYGHGPDDWTLPDGPARDVGSTHVALVAKLYRLMYGS